MLEPKARPARNRLLQQPGKAAWTRCRPAGRGLPLKSASTTVDAFFFAGARPLPKTRRRAISTTPEKPGAPCWQNHQDCRVVPEAQLRSWTGCAPASGFNKLEIRCHAHRICAGCFATANNCRLSGSAAQRHTTPSLRCSR